MRKIEVPTETPPEFELGDTAADIQRRRQKREQREREEAEKQQEERGRGKARRAETPQEEISHTEEGVADVTVMGKHGSNYRLSLSCNRKSKKLNLTNLFNSQQ